MNKIKRLRCKLFGHQNWYILGNDSEGCFYCNYYILTIKDTKFIAMRKTMPTKTKYEEN